MNQKKTPLIKVYFIYNKSKNLIFNIYYKYFAFRFYNNKNLNLKNQNLKNKNVKYKNRDISADKKKPKYNFQIDLKDLIKKDLKEKSMLTPSKRYKDVKKKKKPEEVQYYKPFKFNLNEDY